MSDQRTAADAGRMVYLSAALAILWIGLAFWRPETTWHLGPLVVALSPALVHRSLGVMSRGAALGAVANGLLNTAVATAILAFSDKLRGPELDIFPNVLTEIVAFAAIGALAAFALAITGNREKDSA